MYPRPKLSKRINIILIGLFLALSWTSPTFSDPAKNTAVKRANAEALTHSLVGLNTAYQKAAPAAKSQALQKLIDATVERQALLSELVKTDPGAVLRTAVPERIRKNMPAEVQAFIEQRLELEGELEVMYEDYADGSYRLRHTLKADGVRIALYFKSPPSGLISDKRARVSGVLVDDAMAVESGEDDILMLALDGEADGISSDGSPAPFPNTFGEQNTLVILVNFQDNPVEPYTPQFAHDVIIGETSDFFLENSFGQTWLNGDVTDWYTIPVDSTVCDTLNTRDYAEQAASNAGYDLSNYDRLVYAFPQNACVWWGSASVGGEPSRTSLNGDLELALTGHELGHNLGLYHAHSLVCDDGTSVGPGGVAVGEYPWPNCSHLEYGDGLDIMGWSPSAHFSAYQKERLGWLGFGSSPAIARIDTGGVYELSPYASAGDSNPKALKILKAEDTWGFKTWYYLEYRQPVGFDSFLADNRSGLDTSNVLNGLTVHVGYEGNGGNSLYLLDMTPETNLDPYTRDPALVAGRTFVDPDGVTTITTDWTDASGAVVNVSLAPPVCMASNPSIALSPSESQWVEAGTPVIYTTTLTNQDNASCAAATFELSASFPAAWTANFAEPSLTLNPGASGTTTVTITSSTAAVDGFYDVTVSAEKASDPTYAAAATVTYVVSNPVANQVPVAVEDSATTAQDTEVHIEVLVNDSDPDGDTLMLANVTQGANGTVTINVDGTLTHRPNTGFAGTSSFTYTISDGNGGEDTAAVFVMVVADTSNLGPVASDDDITIQEKTPVTIDVSANDSDPDGDALSIASVTQGAKGTVTINVDDTLLYTPGKRFKNGDSFTYNITDGAASATATVTITLQKQQGGKGHKPKG
jgi:hypothetical protein